MEADEDRGHRNISLLSASVRRPTPGRDPQVVLLFEHGLLIDRSRPLSRLIRSYPRGLAQNLFRLLPAPRVVRPFKEFLAQSRAGQSANNDGENNGFEFHTAFPLNISVSW